MKYFLSCLLFICALLGSSSAKAGLRVESNGQDVYWVGHLVDYGAELGLGRHENYHDSKTSLMLRLRLGATLVRDPMFITLAPVVDVFNNRPGNVGIQLEIVHLQMGAWCQVTPFANMKAETGIALAAGWSIFGAEVQATQKGKDLVNTYFLKMKFPLSLLVFAWTR